ncbi:hypothetical protein DFP72DRAFT_848554 [Ephemerocybe angulata]|uniref:Uncharacterized protein n=1 Tax=Ephemerocybe angulata TaxID=980116 RepID=A0A8H6M7C6_9AGAR|nr:hypothetical protein DFP72DRAFT_848554 [Tulosesus angulatus]
MADTGWDAVVGRQMVVSLDFPVRHRVLEGDTSGDAPLAPEDCTAGGDGSAIFDGGNSVTDSVEDRGTTDKALTISSVPSFSSSGIHTTCDPLATGTALDSLVALTLSVSASCSSPDIRNSPPAGMTVAAFGPSLPGPSPPSPPTSRPRRVSLPNSSMARRSLAIVHSGHVVIDRRFQYFRTSSLSVGTLRPTPPTVVGRSGKWMFTPLKVSRDQSTRKGDDRFDSMVKDAVVVNHSSSGVREGGAYVGFDPPVSGGGESGSDYMAGLGFRISAGACEGNANLWRFLGMNQMEDTRAMFRRIGRHGDIGSDDGGETAFITYDPVRPPETFVTLSSSLVKACLFVDWVFNLSSSKLSFPFVIPLLPYDLLAHLGLQLT